MFRLKVLLNFLINITLLNLVHSRTISLQMPPKVPTFPETFQSEIKTCSPVLHTFLELDKYSNQRCEFTIPETPPTFTRIHPENMVMYVCMGMYNAISQLCDSKNIDLPYFNRSLDLIIKDMSKPDELSGMCDNLSATLTNSTQGPKSEKSAIWVNNIHEGLTKHPDNCLNICFDEDYAVSIPWVLIYGINKKLHGIPKPTLNPKGVKESELNQFNPQDAVIDNDETDARFDQSQIKETTSTTVQVQKQAPEILNPDKPVQKLFDTEQKIIPAVNTPEVVPKLVEDAITPKVVPKRVEDAIAPKVVPESIISKVAPEANTTKVAPESIISKGAPEVIAPKVVPEAFIPVNVPEGTSKTILKATSQAVVKASVQPTVKAPVTQQVVVQKETKQKAIDPVIPEQHNEETIIDDQEEREMETDPDIDDDISNLDYAKSNVDKNVKGHKAGEIYTQNKPSHNREQQLEGSDYVDKPVPSVYRSKAELGLQDVDSEVSLMPWYLMCIFCVFFVYISFTNKKKIVAYVVEGRPGGRHGRRSGNGGGSRPNTANYRKLDSNLEVTAHSNSNASHIIY